MGNLDAVAWVLIRPLLIMLLILFIVLIIMLRRPKRAMRKIESVGDLRGKSYKQLCDLFGKPKQSTTGSNGDRGVCWCISNGFPSGHNYYKHTTIFAWFDVNGRCFDFEYDINR